MRRLAIILVCAAACGGGSIDFEDYPDAYHEAECEYLARCGEVVDVATCLKANIGVTLHISTSERAAVDMGKIKYYGDKAKQCLDAFAARSCDQTSQSSREEPQVCIDLGAGTVGDMGACELGAECISFDCNVPTCSMACCPGTCVGGARPALGTVGQPCTNNPCASGLRCDFTANVCAAFKAQGDTCTSSFDCEYGLGCAGTPRVCAALPTLGQPCPSGLCRDAGTVCSATSQMCVKVGLVGDACTVNSDCSVLYRCDGTKHCAAGIPTGQACTSMDRCSDYQAFCDIPNGASGMCSMPKPDGQACSSNSQCQSYYCDQTTATRVCAVAPVCI